MNKTSIALMFALAGAVSTPAAQAAVPPSLSGSWYDAAHAGHGFSVEVLDARRAIAYWFVYDERGAPIHLYVDGTISGNAIRGPAYLGRGMPFGSFDRSRYVLGNWGEVEIQFTSCTTATVRYDAKGGAGGPQFGRGDIAMTRLSAIGELPCRDETLR